MGQESSGMPVADQADRPKDAVCASCQEAKGEVGWVRPDIVEHKPAPTCVEYDRRAWGEHCQVGGAASSPVRQSKLLLAAAEIAVAGEKKVGRFRAGILQRPEVVGREQLERHCSVFDDVEYAEEFPQGAAKRQVEVSEPSVFCRSRKVAS